MRIADVPEFKEARELASYLETATVQEVAESMSQRNIGAVPVVDKNNKLTGLFSERDLLKKVVVPAKNPAQTKLKDVMTHNPDSLTPDDGADVAQNLMVRGGYRHMPVTDHDGKLVGFLSLRDFAAINWQEVVSKARKNTAVMIGKSPQVLIMILGILLFIVIIVAAYMI